MENIKDVNVVISKHGDNKENLIQIMLELQQLSGKNSHARGMDCACF